jgi:iron uptake system component EfeO
MTRRLVTVAASLALLAPLAACTSNSAGGSGDAQPVADQDSGSISVTSTADECSLSAETAPSGRLVFSVTNDGSDVTEFYLLGEDGQRIVGEVENIGPGLTRDLVLKAPPGKYYTACKPGMVGKGIRAAFTVTDSGKDLAPTGKDAALVTKANRQYAAYVRNETDQLLAETRRFAKRFTSGDDDAARHLYPRARVHWERIETVAESFGDLDPRMDLREADLAEGQKWTGWHRIEKDLWPPESGYQPMSARQRTAVADRLVADTEELHRRVQDMTFTADQIGNCA